MGAKLLLGGVESAATPPADGTTPADSPAKASPGSHALTRRTLLGVLAASGTMRGQGPPKTPVFFRHTELYALRQAFDAPSTAIAKERSALEAMANACLERGPWSVTDERPGDTPTEENDYFSEGPYWWPNPEAPNGPYIRRDGEVNPDRFTRHHNDLRALCETVACLSTAAVLLNEPRYASHAMHLLRVWFVDDATRMNPNLEFGQAIRGRVWGRGIGLIDTVPLIWLVAGLDLLEISATGGTPVRVDAAVLPGVRAWFRDFVHWMTTSEKGIDERDHGNNHSTWWAAQVAAYSTWLGDEAALLRAWTLFYEEIMPKQFLADGSAPKEEDRTRSLSYSAMNLDGIAVICRIGEVWELDLWEFEAENGASAAKAIDYILPFLEEPGKWTKPQITPVQPARHFFPALAGWGLQKPEWLAAQRKLGCEGREICRWVRLLMALSPSDA